MCYFLDGLFREQKFEIFAFVLATIFICFYVIVNYIYEAVITHSTAISEVWTLVSVNTP